MIENIIEVAKRNNLGYILISEADSEFQTLAKKLKGKEAKYKHSMLDETSFRIFSFISGKEKEQAIKYIFTKVSKLERKNFDMYLKQIGFDNATYMLALM